jgi:hypothetical protein
LIRLDDSALRVGYHQLKSSLAQRAANAARSAPRRSMCHAARARWRNICSSGSTGEEFRLKELAVGETNRRRLINTPQCRRRVFHVELASPRALRRTNDVPKTRSELAVKLDNRQDSGPTARLQATIEECGLGKREQSLPSGLRTRTAALPALHDTPLSKKEFSASAHQQGRRR